MPDPIFEIGPVPQLKHCEIQDRKQKNGQWKYFIRNNNNPWGSGWADEDFIINQIKLYGEPDNAYIKQ